MRRRPLAILAVLLLLTGLAVRHPSADIRILTHDARDPMPHRVQAALDLGVMAISVLVTWTGTRI